VENAIAAITVASSLNIEEERSKLQWQTLGVKRRFSISLKTELVLLMIMLIILKS
jgi:hypothetical protein